MAPRSPQRSLLLDAAKHLMLSKGYSGTTVDEVCASAGVTKGSFYHHFESKEALALALIDHYFSEVEAVLLAGPLMPNALPRPRRARGATPRDPSGLHSRMLYARAVANGTGSSRRIGKPLHEAR